MTFDQTEHTKLPVNGHIENTPPDRGVYKSSKEQNLIQEDRDQRNFSKIERDKKRKKEQMFMFPSNYSTSSNFLSKSRRARS